MKRLLALREKAKKEIRKIVLPEGEDERVLRAASYMAKEKITDVTVLGKEDDIRGMAKKLSIDLGGVALLDPATDPAREEIIDLYFKLRERKGVTREDAEKLLMGNFVFYGAMMARLGRADGFVSGASHTTADVARASIQCLSLDREIGTVCSSFVIELEDSPFGENGLFIYADCGIIPYPNSRQLAGIAIATSDLFNKLFDVEPRVALLSFSTKGSAEGESVDLVRAALGKVKEKRPSMLVDGELQLDAAIVPSVAEKKCKGSPVAGKANVLIFPSLDAGNIAYKLTERLAGAKAIGPIIQGMDKPCSDLSRGCSWDDVVDAAVVTAVRMQGK
ncbi:MAG: phosphate acetyltransferase [Candidatus Omnitrophica bacterium]|nr:phosphate acetyltransferase [Candidatus Omnitrophota bacterium]MDD5488780.1 phosphate acetyltransferase [Candidatus Omnitrophota bacterium]